MKFHKKTALALSAIGLLAASAASFAQPTLSYNTTNYGPQVNDPFGGFDWNSAGSAVTTGFVPDGITIFTTEYWADAVAVARPNGSNFLSPLAAAGFNPSNGVLLGAEFTINAIIQETAVLTATGADFTAVGGTWEIFYEPLANANLETGGGITDGVKILGGTIQSGFAGSFAPVGDGGSGDFTFRASVDFTNPAYIVPDLARTTTVSTIQFGTSTTNWTPPTGVPGDAGASDPLPVTELIFQADANQSFSVVPVPATVLLIGLGMLGLSRRMARI